MKKLYYRTEFVELVARIMGISMDDILCVAQIKKPGRKDYLGCEVKIVTKDGEARTWS